MSPPQISNLLIEKIVKEPVETFSTGEGSKKGDNVAGNLLALNVKTKSGKELNLVYKSLPQEGFQKEFSVTSKTFWTENTFYAEFAPALQNWAKSRGFDSPVIPTPTFLDGFNDDDSDYVCMEDVRHQDYRMADKFVGLSFEETSMVLKELGQYHALTYSFIKWEGEKLFEKPEFSILSKNFFGVSEEQLIQTEDIFKGSYQMSVELIEKIDKALAEKLKKAAPNTLDDCFATSMRTDEEYFPVIILGDLWVNNILFKYGNNGCPNAVKFIDFQLTRRGNIYEELQYFIFTSTTPEFRKEHLLQVLGIYFESFMSTFEAIKCHPPLNFTRGKFIDTFFINNFPAFIYMCFAIPMQLGTPMDFGGPPPAPEEVQASSDAEQQGPHTDGNFDPNALKLKMMIGGLRMSMETSPLAMDRLIKIANEMADLKVF